MTREFVLRETVEDSRRGSSRNVVILSWTCSDSELPPGVEKREVKRGRVRGIMHLRGYLLESSTGDNGEVIANESKVTYCESVELRGLLPADLTARNMAPTDCSERNA